MSPITAFQRANIIKTLVVLLAIMGGILALFIHKLTTPRYLSNVELRVNHLVLLPTPQSISLGDAIANRGMDWRIIAMDDQQQVLLGDLWSSLKPAIQRKTHVVPSSPLLETQLRHSLPMGVIPIVQPDGQLGGYFRQPFDQDQMRLTYSSLVTHRF